MGVHEVNQTITRMVDSTMSTDSASGEVRELLLTLASRAFAAAGRLDDDAEAVAGLEQAVAACARLGVDLHTTLSLVIGAIELVVDVAPATSPFATDSGQVLRAVRTATGIVARVHGRAGRQTQQSIEAGQEVAAALLRGDASKVLGQCNQIGVADAYAIVALYFPGRRGRQPGAPRSIAEPTVARLYSELGRRFGPSALALLGETGTTILIPDTAFAEFTAIAAFVETLRIADGNIPTGVAMRAPTSELPLVAEQVHAALDVVVRLGMTGRLHRFSDIAVEYQLTRPGPGRDALATLLDPLEDHPDLLETLRTYVECGLDRRRTARRLHLHPNSVDYRLKRIFRLTGFDIADPTGLWNLRSALVIRDHHTEFAAVRA
ncbi:transcriptional regulator [Nocardia neocaledoniensis NBRC 108232]|uniref:PucR-like helix-turn-helix protein n=1 Tax=Nocardia neocaledoniensis TaxID=236511 RepID=A0A317N3H4_9NOCA|nr:helix-turn-helix domain-containing protein [Nocardia neocaledoniensis]PWV68946.1 PucR-like helix-turn-helix protein [Nocardia neocaledoniensis]GEM29586.1 transcriptional regulator [Nocardia neocaledoniensis NBRC 108232]